MECALDPCWSLSEQPRHMFFYPGRSLLSFGRWFFPLGLLLVATRSRGPYQFVLVSKLRGTIPSSVALLLVLSSLSSPDVPVFAVSFFLSWRSAGPGYPEEGCSLLGCLGSPGPSARRLFSSASSASRNFASLHFLSLAAAGFPTPPRTSFITSSFVRH